MRVRTRVSTPSWAFLSVVGQLPVDSDLSTLRKAHETSMNTYSRRAHPPPLRSAPARRAGAPRPAAPLRLERPAQGAPQSVSKGSPPGSTSVTASTAPPPHTWSPTRSRDR